MVTLAIRLGCATTKAIDLFLTLFSGIIEERVRLLRFTLYLYYLFPYKGACLWCLLNLYL